MVEKDPFGVCTIAILRPLSFNTNGSQNLFVLTGVMPI